MRLDARARNSKTPRYHKIIIQKEDLVIFFLFWIDFKLKIF